MATCFLSLKLAIVRRQLVSIRFCSRLIIQMRLVLSVFLSSGYTHTYVLWLMLLRLNVLLSRVPTYLRSTATNDANLYIFQRSVRRRRRTWRPNSSTK